MSEPRKAGRPPLPPRTWSLPAVRTVCDSLSREAAMLRIVSRNFVGSGEREDLLRLALIAKSHELEKLAESMMELP